MKGTPARARAAAGGLGLALLATLLVTAPPAQAAGSPPVTTDDAASMYAGNAVVVDVLVNDTDADGDELAICRLPESTTRQLDVFADGGQLVVLSTPKAPPGDYQFSYYACDFEVLTEGTLTVTIKPEPRITMRKLANRPGKLKVKNPSDLRVEILYGSFREPAPDGRIVLRKHSSTVIIVHRTRINWIAYHARRGDFLKVGRVKNIKLPPGDELPALGRVTMHPKTSRLWNTW